MELNNIYNIDCMVGMKEMEKNSVNLTLTDIPYGEVRSYKEIAEAVGCPKGARAVGLANNKNPIVIATPCHRVIGADGALVGFGGGLPVKEFLLRLEGALPAQQGGLF